jgi:phosphatidylglycerol---prolipoprotein diacylglyceryl transferase
LIFATLADATSAIRFKDLGLSPIALDLGFFKIRWYSLAYIVGILLGWWQITKMVARPGSPMSKAQVDDFVLFAALGIILGGRVGFVVFYSPKILLHPLDIMKLWQGGMSFHGGVLGVMLAIFLFCRKNGLSWLRVHDYIAVVYPLGHLLGRLANFVNGELWGRPTNVAWGIVFPKGGEVARHPSQLYQGATEGLLLALILWFLFWKTDARNKPGMLAGAFVSGMGLFRFIGEFFREPDAGVTGLFGMTMGQTLCVPMVIVGIYLVATAKNRTITQG